jgi:hypothetical protein
MSTKEGTRAFALETSPSRDILKPTSMPSKTCNICVNKLGTESLGRPKSMLRPLAIVAPTIVPKRTAAGIGSFRPKKAPAAPKAKRIRRARVRLKDTTINFTPTPC